MIHHWKQFIETFQTVDVWRISYKMYLKLFEKWPSISLLVLDKCLTDVRIRIWELKFISPIGPILSSEVKKTHYIPWTCYVALNTIDLYGLDHMCKCIVVKSQFWIKFGPQIQKILIDENFIIHLEVYNLLLYMIQPQYVVYVLTGCCKKRGEKRRSIFRLSVSTLSSNTISQQYIILYVERKTICMDTLLYIWYIRLDNTYSVMMDLVR